MVRRRLTPEERAARIPRGWRLHVRAVLDVETIDAQPVCPSGTLVCALLALRVPLSDIAQACAVEARVLRRTVRAGAVRCACATCVRRRMGREVLDDGAYRRVEAYLAAVVARGTEGAAQAQAWAEVVGVRL